MVLDRADDGGSRIRCGALGALGWAVVRSQASDDDGENAVGSLLAPTTSQALEGRMVAITTDEGTATSGPEAFSAPATTTVAEVTAAPTTSTSSTTTTTTVAPTTTVPVAPYESLPDGTPLPLIVTFDTNRITLQGVVPDQAAKDRIPGARGG